jgi:hypothetical protein
MRNWTIETVNCGSVGNIKLGNLKVMFNEHDGVEAIKFIKTSILSGITRSKWVKGVTLDGLSNWEGGDLIQDALSEVSIDDREFIMTGITPKEWDSVYDEEKHTLVTTNNNITKE